MSSGKWKGGDGFEVGSRGSAEAREMEKMQEPLVQEAITFRPKDADNAKYGGSNPAYPAIYGVDLKERERQKVLAEVSRGQLSGGARSDLGQMIGDRQVMFTERDAKWLIQEQERMQLINKDAYFEESAIKSGLFSTPHGLEYLHKIRPSYFRDREKLVEWVSAAQLKLFNLRFNGVQSEQDFDFMYMLQGLSEKQKSILQKPVWLLNEFEAEDDITKAFQPGLFARPRAPELGVTASFAGMGSKGGSGVGLKPAGSNFWGGIFGGTRGNDTSYGFGSTPLTSLLG
jgi:hypothetical protein